jgi:hypothetical protein
MDRHPNHATRETLVPAFKVLTNSALPLAVRMLGELLDGAAKLVGSDAEGVIHLKDDHRAVTEVIELPLTRRR